MVNTSKWPRRTSSALRPVRGPTAVPRAARGLGCPRRRHERDSDHADRIRGCDGARRNRVEHGRAGHARFALLKGMNILPKRRDRRGTVEPHERTTPSGFGRQPIVNPRQCSPHESGALAVRQMIGQRNAWTPCSYAGNKAMARVQSVPQRQRLKPNASKMRASGSHISLYGNGSCDSVQAPLILSAMLS